FAARSVRRRCLASARCWMLIIASRILVIITNGRALSLTSLATWRSRLYMPTNLLLNLTVKQLRGAVRVRERIDKLQTQLGRILAAQGPETADPSPKRRKMKRKMSAAARARLSAAAKARWKKVKAKGGKSL